MDTVAPYVGMRHHLTADSVACIGGVLPQEQVADTYVNSGVRQTTAVDIFKFFASIFF